jgi:hypothetical protein
MKRPKGIPCGNTREFDALMFSSPKTRRAPMENGTVILKRTFNQSMPAALAVELDPGHFFRLLEMRQRPSVRYWRVMAPANHPNINSDLSLEGLREAGIVQ